MCVLSIKASHLFLHELWWVHLQSWGKRGTWLAYEERSPMIPHTVKTVKHDIFIIHAESGGKKNAQFHSQSCFGIRPMIHCEGKKKFTTYTYLKLLARPVSFVARNLYSVDSTIYGANIPWLFQVCPGGLQAFFLKEKKNPAPACNDPLLSEYLDFWDSQQYTGTCILPVLRT